MNLLIHNFVHSQFFPLIFYIYTLILFIHILRFIFFTQTLLFISSLFISFINTYFIHLHS